MKRLQSWHFLNNGGECIDADECLSEHSEFGQRRQHRCEHDASNSQGCCGPASAAMLLKQQASSTFDNIPCASFRLRGFLEYVHGECNVLFRRNPLKYCNQRIALSSLPSCRLHCRVCEAERIAPFGNRPQNTLSFAIAAHALQELTFTGSIRSTNVFTVNTRAFEVSVEGTDALSNINPTTSDAILKTWGEFLYSVNSPQLNLPLSPFLQIRRIAKFYRLPTRSTCIFLQPGATGPSICREQHCV